MDMTRADLREVLLKLVYQLDLPSIDAEEVVEDYLDSLEEKGDLDFSDDEWEDDEEDEEQSY